MLTFRPLTEVVSQGEKHCNHNREHDVYGGFSSYVACSHNIQNFDPV